ncbi:hypothetical protein Tery_0492 [Trichodesmium erythraeum IMS101]|uniref:Uncharacterized protein n=1 Tax=Trichodesmium erythraeum (strain IMS101) TaxID=203124 RepID=Q118X6_TRIEI|nr:DUF2786 domain-containing protein [Trichodesmium erythraeum GBRTRLIN201]MCH2048825.1 DUF2786 domain-containing protein [Trichodesmium sp. ALOHA_ZT_67]MDT9339830.1 DUF2786 domain-containing protein [Trichodesmium erythraeum 21-75]
MVDQNLLEKISKLLALTSSPNEHEAALAAEKAAELLAKHNLSVADLGQDKDEDITKSIVDKTGRYVTWKMWILAGIANANGCQAMRSTYSGEMRIVGTETNITVSRSLYEYLTAVVDKLVKQHRGKGRVFINAFRVGCATRLRQRLEQRRKYMEEKGIASNGDDDSKSASAIVVRSMFEKHTLAIQAYLKQEGVKCKTQKSSKVNSDLGFSFGYIAGEKVRLNYWNQNLHQDKFIKKVKV